MSVEGVLKMFTGFNGRFDHNLNPRNQVAVPAEFRRVLDEERDGSGLVLFDAGVDYLYLYPPVEWRRVRQDIEQDSSMSEAEKREFINMVAANAKPLSFDTQGRILLSENFKKSVGIKKEVAFVGAGSFIQLWDTKKRDKYESAKAKEYRAKLARFGSSIFEKQTFER